MKLLMENWRQYVAEIEQEEPQQLDEGIVDNLKKLGMAAAATAGLGVGTAQAAGISGVDVFDDAGNTIAQIDLNSEQVGELADRFKSGAVGGRLQQYGDAMEILSKSTKHDGWAHDKVEEAYPLLANAISWYATGVYERGEAAGGPSVDSSEPGAASTSVGLLDDPGPPATVDLLDNPQWRASYFATVAKALQDQNAGYGARGADSAFAHMDIMHKYGITSQKRIQGGYTFNITAKDGNGVTIDVAKDEIPRDLWK
jgi:hypothetical protein